MRTYLIEPQTVFVPYLRRVLSAAGLDVVAAGQSVDTRDIRAHTPDAVFVDVDFFDHTVGASLCKIREAARSAAVIALSANEDALFHASCVISGASAVCSKSDDEMRFVRSLRLALQRAARPVRAAAT